MAPDVSVNRTSRTPNETKVRKCRKAIHDTERKLESFDSHFSSIKIWMVEQLDLFPKRTRNFPQCHMYSSTESQSKAQLTNLYSSKLIAMEYLTLTYQRALVKSRCQFTSALPTQNRQYGNTAISALDIITCWTTTPPSDQQRKISYA